MGFTSLLDFINVKGKETRSWKPVLSANARRSTNTFLSYKYSRNTIE